MDGTGRESIVKRWFGVTDSLSYEFSPSCPYAVIPVKGRCGVLNLSMRPISCGRQSDSYKHKEIYRSPCFRELPYFSSYYISF